MDDIQDVIRIMSERDRNNFLRFLNVEKEKNDRSDHQLFQELSVEEKKTGGQKSKKEKRSGKNGQDAYHQNRKRLMEKLTDYYVLKSRKEDITGAARIQGLITMSRYLFEAKMNRVGWKIIRKAEKLAHETDQYALLNAIYLLMIEHADSFHATDIKTLIRKKTEAYKLAQQEENMLMATQIIKQKLHEVKTSGKSLNFSVYLRTVTNKFKISEAVLQDPKHLFSIIQLMRNSYLAVRDLKQFEHFALEQYKLLESQFGFKKQHHTIKIELEYMIAHVLYRSRKYKQSLEYLGKMYFSMSEYAQSHFNAYYPKYVSLRSSILSFTGNNNGAIELLENIFRENRRMSIKDELNMYLNLAVFYHFKGEFEKTNMIFRKQRHRDDWIENKMGREFVVRKNLIYAVNLYELHQEDEALECLQQITVIYSDLLDLPQYEKVKVYIEMLGDYFKDPHHLSPRLFMANMNSTSEKFSLQAEENKTIAFFCWLLSKVKKVDYYELTMEMVKR
jgi:hypothetical protein